MTKTTSHGMTDAAMSACIEECQNCHTSCLSAVGHCLTLGGQHAEPSHIALLLDCSEICETSANFMIRGSSRHARICAACADVCRACEEDCRRFGDDDMMRQCADACRRCAESCETMAGAQR